MPTTKARVTLREVTRENLRDVLLLEVAPEQRQFVASNAISNTSSGRTERTGPKRSTVFWRIHLSTREISASVSPEYAFATGTSCSPSRSRFSRAAAAAAFWQRRAGWR